MNNNARNMWFQEPPSLIKRERNDVSVFLPTQLRGLNATLAFCLDKNKILFLSTLS